MSNRMIRNMFAGVLFFEVVKAFDIVWHNAVINKIVIREVPPMLVLIIRNYLTDRTLRYRVEGVLSAPQTIRADVPQGSVLSPLPYS